MSEAGQPASVAGGDPRMPTWVVGLALLVWGWSADVPALAFPLLVLVLSPLWYRRRFAFSATDFHRALDVCWVLLLGGVMLVYSRESMGGVLRSFAQWLPLVVFPAVMAQVWSLRGVSPVSALVPLPGWRREVDPRATFDVAPIFVVICLLAGSTVRGDRAWFYLGVAVVGTAGLWSARARNQRTSRVVVALGVAAAAGWFTSLGIGTVQSWVEGRVLSLVTRWRGEDRSDRVTRTAIGRTGDVAGTSQVVMRVVGVGRAPVPKRLRVATYYSWREGAWFAPHGEAIKVESQGDEWRLDPRPGHDHAVVVEWVPARTGRFVPLPEAARSIGELVANRVERSPIGAVRAELRAGMVAYRVQYGPDSNWEAEPTAEDREGVPVAEVAGIQAVVDEIGLAGLAPAEVMRRVEGHFARHFRYTTTLVDTPLGGVRSLTPVGRFLLGSRAGHCEYFATAAVLILRRVGVPARYATGYLVSAGETEGNAVVVRDRQEHAWVRAWVDGAWRDFDPTPSDLVAAARAEGMDWTARLERAWDDAVFGVSHWWWLGEKRVLRHVYWLAVPVLGWLFWRLRRVREALGSGPVAVVPVEARVWPGTDSEWLPVVEWLAGRGWARRAGESADRWWRRLAAEGWPAGMVRTAARAQRTHERLRFDPRGIGDTERRDLRAAAEAVLGWKTEGPKGAPAGKEPAAGGAAAGGGRGA